MLRMMLTVLLFATANSGLRAAEGTLKEVAGMLPSSVAVFVQVNQPAGIVDYVMSHPLRKSVETTTEFVQFKKSKEFSAFRGGVALFEAALGMKWEKAVGEIAGDGVFFAADPSLDAFAILLKGTEAETTHKFAGVLLSTLRLGDQEIQEGDYRGVDVFRTSDIAVAHFDRWMIATNKPDFGKAIVDRYLKPGATDTLAANENFVSNLNNTSANARVLFDISQIRELGIAPALYSGKTENILAEFLIGGLAGSLATAPSAVAELHLHTDEVNLSIMVPHAEGFPDENRSYFFAPSDESAAPSLVQVAGRVAAMSAYRGLAEAWLRSGDLMIDKATEELAQADSQLSTFFSGKDFGEDILGAFAPRVQIVVQRQSFQRGPVPDLKLPAFAFVFRMLDAKETSAEMRRVFISLLGFLNVVGAMEGQPQFDIETSRDGEMSVVSAAYIPPSDEGAVPINYNFSPTLVTKGDRLIVSSGRALANEIAAASTEQPPGTRLNTNLEIDLEAVKMLLDDNLEQLLAQNMLEKGHSREDAQQEIGLLLRLASFFQSASLEFANQPSQLEMGITVRFSGEAPGPADGLDH